MMVRNAASASSRVGLSEGAPAPGWIRMIMFIAGVSLVVRPEPLMVQFDEFPFQQTEDRSPLAFVCVRIEQKAAVGRCSAR